MAEATIHLRATETCEGQPYLVKQLDSGEIKVFSVITPRPVTAHGGYSVEKIYRTIKPGSANYRAAVKASGITAP